MSKPVAVVLVGIGGYGEVYLGALLDEEQGKRCTIVGTVDPEPQRCSRLPELGATKVPVFGSPADFFAHGQADLAVLSSPIQLHTEQTCLALEHECNVLVEKPAAATPADIDLMIESRDRAGRFVAVGYQWSFAGSIQRLKRDILSGEFGAPIKGSCLTLWPRTESYYTRNNWAGKERDSAGRWILDSPANNAMAHFLYNLLFLCGDEMDRSAEPESVEAFLGRTNDIETFDTIASTIRTKNGVELLFLASHAIEKSETTEPCFKLEFEKATVEFAGEGSPIVVQLRDGQTIEYTSPNRSSQTRKLWAAVDAVVAGSGAGRGGGKMEAPSVEQRTTNNGGIGEPGAGRSRAGRSRGENGANLGRGKPGTARLEQRAPNSGGIGNRESGSRAGRSEGGPATRSIPCGLETARPHSVCIQMLHELQVGIQVFDKKLIRVTDTDSGRLRWVEGLGKQLREAYRRGRWEGE